MNAPRPLHWLMACGLVLAILIPGVRSANAQPPSPGSADPAFAQTTVGSGLNSRVQSLAVQGDGKILAGGNFTEYVGVSARKLIRLNPDGTRDATFTQTGTGFDEGIRSVLIQPDGKILAGGSFTSYDGSPAPYLIRLNPDGTRDATFTQTGTGLDDGVRSLALQGDGKVLVGGNFTTYNGQPAPRLIRLNPDGTRDATFTQTGTGLNTTVYSLARQADEKILVGGNFTTYNGQPAPRLIRLNPDGTRDATFTQTGTGLNDGVETLAVQGDDRILVGGSFTTYDDQPAPRLIRLNPDGTRDATFAQTGAGLDNTVESVAVRPDGTIVAGGNFSAYNSDQVAYLIRLKPDGTRDTGFAASGLSGAVDAVALPTAGGVLAGGNFTTFGGDPAPHLIRLHPDGTRDAAFVQTGSGLNSRVLSVATQEDGKIVAGGWFASRGPKRAPYLVRLTPDGSADPTFAPTGAGLDGTVTSVAVQSDGKIVVGGTFTVYGADPAAYLVRLNADGTRDATFNQTGSGLGGAVDALVVQADGKILVGGNFTTYNGQPAPRLIRLNRDGTRDNTFNQTGTGVASRVLSIAVQPDTKVLVGGWFSSYNGTAAPKLIRLNPDGTRDATFNQTGTGLSNGVASLAVRPDGKILAGGSFTTYNGQSAPRLIRLNPDGTRDNTFNQTGTGLDNRVLSLALQSNGQIVAGGRFATYNGQAASHLIRLNPDGTRDNTFNQTGSGLSGAVASVRLRADGAILAGGEFTTFASMPYAYLVQLVGGGGDWSPPGLATAPSALGFGEWPVDSTSTPSTITVTNTGTSLLTFGAGAIAIGGDHAKQFAIGEDACSRTSVAPGETCAVGVRFTPNTSGPKNAQLQLTSNAAGGPHTVSLSGTGTTTPPPTPQPQTAKPPVKKLKPTKKAGLPPRTQQGAAITWKAKTKKICTVKAKKVKALRKGTCRLSASAPAVPGYLPYKAAAKIKVR